MIDREKIPDPVYYDLIELFGYEKAERIVDDCKYNYRSLMHVILNEHLERKFGIKERRDYLKKSLRERASINYLRLKYVVKGFFSVRINFILSVIALMLLILILL